MNLKDKRSRKIVVLAHCLLNQNSKVFGIAIAPGAIPEIVEFLLKHEIGILQMPCPEMMYWGIRRWGMVREQYNVPFFREFCKRIAKEIVFQISDYVKNGYKVLAIVGADGSPVCGVNWTNEEIGSRWGGFLEEEILRRKPPKQKFVRGEGIFIEILRRELDANNIKIPFLAYPEFSELGSISELVNKLKELLEA